MNTMLRTAGLLALATTTLTAAASDGADGRSRALEVATVNARDPLVAPFLKLGTYTQLTLSPDGKHLAGVAVSPGGTNTAIVMIDTDTLTPHLIVQPRVWKVTGYQPYVRNPRQVGWISNDRIVVNFTMPDAAIFGIDGTLYPVDLMQGYLHAFRDATGKATDSHLVIREAAKMTLSVVNARTNDSTDYDLDLPKNPISWATDLTGQVRAARTLDTAFWSDRSVVTTWYRSSVEAKWQKVDERSVTADPFVPLFMSNRPDHIAVATLNGGDRVAIWDFDVATRTIGELMAGHESEDIAAVAMDDDASEVKSVVTDGLKRRTYWFQPRYARLQASIDASLPDSVNVLYPNPSDQILVYSYSDVDPGRWYLLDSALMKMKEVARRRPAIDPERMQAMRTLRYPSFDGVSIPAYLTLPGKPTQPAPLVVLIHGGPQARDRWGFDDEVQILAGHGYAVFQPQFRGSTGFGKKFEESGYGQWGLAMQDDITAGVKYLIDQKIADPQRICIVGASYGGYAALWGLAKTPDLYKCGVSVAGVSDLQRMEYDGSDITHNAVAREIARQRKGDSKDMAVTFDSVSPLKHADQIKAPLLIVHGALDRRVPIVHGKKMRDAMQDLHKDVQWIEFPHEGHGVNLPEDEVVYYDALFALLARTLGKGEPPFPIPAAAPAAAASAP